MGDTLKKYHHIQNVRFESDALLCEIDGVELSFRLSEISKKLMQASQFEREKFEISPSGYGIHWQFIDEDLSIDGLLGIRHEPTAKKENEISV